MLVSFPFSLSVERASVVVVGRLNRLYQCQSKTSRRKFHADVPPVPGMEYVRTHNLALARNFLMGALSLSPSDPLVLNEVRVALCA